MLSPNDFLLLLLVFLFLFLSRFGFFFHHSRAPSRYFYFTSIMGFVYYYIRYTFLHHLTATTNDVIDNWLFFEKYNSA